MISTDIWYDSMWAFDLTQDTAKVKFYLVKLSEIA